MIVAAQLLEPLTVATAKEIAGPLGKPSKMPGYAYGLPAKDCKVGSVLRLVPNSVCNKCYAFKGNYTWANVKTVQEKRLASLNHPRWIEAMVTMIQATDTRHFRWHDSGDIQSPTHLERIVQVAQLLPRVKFWIPTREKVFVYSHLKKHGAFPKNLVVRVSGTMIDGPVPTGFPNTSTVTTGKATCPAPSQDNNCGACRRCWNPKVKNVSYAKH